MNISLKLYLVFRELFWRHEHFVPIKSYVDDLILGVKMAHFPEGFCSILFLNLG